MGTERPIWLEEFITFSDVLSVGGKVDLTPVDITHDDLAFLQYTGGTTGVAKGAMLSHGNMVANMLQATAWIRAFTDENTREGIFDAMLGKRIRNGDHHFAVLFWTLLDIANPGSDFEV